MDARSYVIMVLYIKEKRNVSNMMGLRQQRTTWFSWKALPPPSDLGLLPRGAFTSNEPGWKGKKAGTVEILSDTIIRLPMKNPAKGYQRIVWAQCVKCRGMPYWRHWEPILGGRSTGCQSCAEAETPMYRWLRKRLQAAKDRCTNSSHKQWRRYGGRGITFDFSSVRAATEWCLRNLDLPSEPTRRLELDRIENNKGYAAGNLRLTSRAENQINRDITCMVDIAGTKIPYVHAIHVFRARNPEIRFADNTLRNLLPLLGEDGVRQHWAKQRGSGKPVGVYGTFLKPDPVIVSRYLGV